MDVGYSYLAADGAHASVYAPAAFLAPEKLILGTQDRQPVTFYRASDRDLECRDVAGVKGHCGSFECHRTVIGVCQCGRHDVVEVRTAATVGGGA